MEKAFSRVHRAEEESQIGLTRSLQRAVEKMPLNRLPSVRVFPDPSPNVLIVKGPGGPGTLLISQGLVALLKEEELRALFKLCAERSQSPGLLLQTLCSFMACRLFDLAPKDWVQLVLSGGKVKPSLRKQHGLVGFRVFVFLMILPIALIFLKIGGDTRVASFKNDDPERNSNLNNALQKIERNKSMWEVTGNPGSASLFLVDPWSRGALLSWRTQIS